MALIDTLAAVQGPGIRIIAAEPSDLSGDRWRLFAAAADRLGYVAIDCRKHVPSDQRCRIRHRHVALIHHESAIAECIQWVRELAHASPRAHVVITIEPLPDRVHESQLGRARGVDLFSAPRPGLLAARAQRLWARRRMAAARRWTTAALEHARRLKDEAGAAQAFDQLVRFSDAVAGDFAVPLVARGRQLLEGLDELAPRSYVVAALADLWLTAGDFEAAAAALAAVSVECQLLGIAVPDWVLAPQCELLCWLGCWDEVQELAQGSALSGWRAVAALGRRDWDTVRLLAACGPAAGGDVWGALIGVMSHGVNGDVGQLKNSLELVRTLAGPSRWRDALMLESLLMAGAADEAADWVRLVGSRSRGRAELLLWNWITRGQLGGTSALETQIRQLGAGGIRRWGVRRDDMHVWAGVSALLTQVQEAEDSMTALTRGCRWAREYTGLQGVAIVSVEDVVIAGDPEGPRRPGMTPAQREAIRYGGVRIGDVIASGEPRDAGEARSVVMALATATAPALRARLDDLQVVRAGQSLAGELLGVSPAMRDLRDAVARAASSTFPVLIEGESGTGKELVARAVHRLSARRDRRWAAVNCAALTDELIEAELFGHVRGAFTGAIGPRTGLLEDAHEGTLFLDEVGELSPRAQAKLLRVLQEGEIRRVGENASRRVDVRLVTATNRSLGEAARQGLFREDLIFRLAVIGLRLPPLRDRIEDIPVLANAFWRTIAGRAQTRAVLGPDAVAALCRASWPGNVRELQNFIAALAVGGPSAGRIGARHVESLLADRSVRPDTPPPTSLARARLQCDRRVVAASLARHANRRAPAARELGVSRQALAKLIVRLNLEEGPRVAGSAGTTVASGGGFR